MHSLDFTHEVRIKATSDRVWDALVNPETVAKYHLAPLHRLELKKDGTIVYGGEEKPLITGKIIDFQKEQKLTHSFRFDPINQPATASDPETVVTYEIQADGDETALKLSHTGFTEENQTRANISGGWPFILDRLKASLEEK